MPSGAPCAGGGWVTGRTEGAKRAGDPSAAREWSLSCRVGIVIADDRKGVGPDAAGLIVSAAVEISGRGRHSPSFSEESPVALAECAGENGKLDRLGVGVSGPGFDAVGVVRVSGLDSDALPLFAIDGDWRLLLTSGAVEFAKNNDRRFVCSGGEAVRAAGGSKFGRGRMRGHASDGGIAEFGSCCGDVSERESVEEFPDADSGCVVDACGIGAVGSGDPAEPLGGEVDAWIVSHGPTVVFPRASGIDGVIDGRPVFACNVARSFGCTPIDWSEISGGAFEIVAWGASDRDVICGSAAGRADDALRSSDDREIPLIPGPAASADAGRVDDRFKVGSLSGDAGKPVRFGFTSERVIANGTSARCGEDAMVGA